MQDGRVWLLGGDYTASSYRTHLRPYRPIQAIALRQTAEEAAEAAAEAEAEAEDGRRAVISVYLAHDANVCVAVDGVVLIVLEFERLFDTRCRRWAARTSARLLAR